MDLRKEWMRAVSKHLFSLFHLVYSFIRAKMVRSNGHGLTRKLCESHLL